MTPLRAYGTLLGITLLNPATVIYFSALVVGSKAAGASTAGQGAVFVLGAFVASACWQLLLVAGGMVLGRDAHRQARPADHRVGVQCGDPGADGGVAARRLSSRLAEPGAFRIGGRSVRMHQ